MWCSEHIESGGGVWHSFRLCGVGQRKEAADRWAWDGRHMTDV
jgi:hypothetical protein